MPSSKHTETNGCGQPQYVKFSREYGNMEYYIIIVCQSNDSLVNIDFEVRAAARPKLYIIEHLHTDNTNDYWAGNNIRFCRSRERVSDVKPFQYLTHSKDERRPISQLKRVILQLFFFKCPYFMDVHVLLLLICGAFQGWRTHMVMFRDF